MQGNKETVVANMRADAVRIFKTGLKAVDPEVAVAKVCRRDGNRLHIGPRELFLDDFENINVIGCGKAAAAMAKAMEAILSDRIAGGIVTVKYGHTDHLERIEIVEAGHPVPDENGRRGAERLLAMAKKAGKNDLLFCLISGGGSALLPLPAPGLRLEHKQDTIKALMACGADIHEINTIRKHTSDIKGGRLAQAAHPATLVTLILSDVVGDDLDVIASGPCVPDASLFQDCMAIVNKYGITDRLPKAVTDYLQAGIEGKVPETPKPDNPVFRSGFQLIVGSNIEAIQAAGAEAARRGYRPLILSSMFEGDTRELARIHGAIVKEVLKSGHPISPPACLLSGGETTVVIRGEGVGGRNQEFALALAPVLAGRDPIVALSAGTDGTDGPTDAAGAVVDNTTIERAEILRLDYRRFLDTNDAYRFFSQTGDLLITGPTNTNVMDMRVVLVAANKTDVA